MSSKIRVAIIGAGPAARKFHFPSLAEMPDVEMVAVCDLNAERREAAMKDFSVPRGHEDYRAMIERESPDAVYVVMYPQHLDPIVTYCLERGIHLFIEKPAGISSEQTRRWAALAQRRSCLTMVGFNRRFTPLIREFRRRVEEAGPVRNFLIEFYKPQPAEGADEVTAILGFLNQGSHHVDLLRWIGGEPVEVHSLVDRHYSNWTNSVTAMVRFEGGARGVLAFNYGAGVSRLERIVLHGNHVTGVMNDTNAGGTISRAGAQETLTREQVVTKPGYHHEYGYFQENRHFIDCLRSGRQPDTNFAESAGTMALIEKLQGRTA